MSVPLELFLAMLVGTVLRLYRLGEQAFWIDEVFMITMTTERTLGELLFEVPQFEPHPPLYNVFMWGWVRLAGISEVSMRFTSVLFSVATLPVAYLLVRKLFDRPTAAVTVAFLAISPLQIWYAQEGRMYALLVFLTVLSFYLLVRLSDSFSCLSAASYVTVGVLMGYLHVYGLFVLLAQALYLGTRLLINPSDLDVSWRSGGSIYVSIGFLTSPWTGLLLHRAIAPEQYPADAAAWLQSPEPSALVETFSLFSFGVTKATRPYNILTHPSEVFLMAVVLCLLVLIGLSTMGEIIKETNQFSLVVLWLVVPIGVPFILSVAVRPMFELRYLIVAAPAFLILVARSIQLMESRYLRYALITVILIGMLVPLPGYYTEPHKDQWDDAAEYVDDNAISGDTILVVPGWTWNGPSDAFNHYFSRDDVSINPLYSFSPQEEYQSAVSDGGDVYLVLSYTNEREAIIDSVAMATETEPTERHEFVNIVVVTYEVQS
ncbi:glycosyltransferase family 39 protein [Halovenus salina]|uniref:glycosyltransferase family 39 protein n=2 Tax=Halovenus salina TaxID=1510225 RepID=UPI0036D42B43